MTMGHRQDTLDDFCNHFNWRQTVQLSKVLSISSDKWAEELSLQSCHYWKSWLLHCLRQLCIGGVHQESAGGSSRFSGGVGQASLWLGERSNQTLPIWLTNWGWVFNQQNYSEKTNVLRPQAGRHQKATHWGGAQTSWGRCHSSNCYKSRYIRNRGPGNQRGSVCNYSWFKWMLIDI